MRHLDIPERSKNKAPVCESVIIKVNDICFASSYYPDLPVDDDTSCTGRKTRDIKHNKKNK